MRAGDDLLILIAFSYKDVTNNAVYSLCQGNAEKM
jgi:hypothetical protein